MEVNYILFKIRSRIKNNYTFLSIKKSIRVHEKAIYDDSTHTLVNDDIIPFDDCEYEKLSQTSLNDSEMSNTEGNNHRLDSYYSLTNIDFYNIDDDDYDGDSCTQREKMYQTNDNASIADAKKDIGYSTDNENECGSLLTAKNLARRNRKQKLSNNKNIKQKSLSDNNINTSRRTANRMRHYKNFFSRYSRLIDSDNDDDYDDYIDDRAESVDSKCTKQYGSQTFGIKQSSTTSGAYDTSSNLSADYNQVNCFFLDGIASNSEDKKVYDGKLKEIIVFLFEHLQKPDLFEFKFWTNLLTSKKQMQSTKQVQQTRKCQILTGTDIL
jgi:hypothetical protein